MQLHNTTVCFLPHQNTHPLTSLAPSLTHMASQKSYTKIHTDQRGELAGSFEIQAMALKNGYIVELTGAEASFQNGISEHPHCTLVQMMRCQLSAPLSYWSFALYYVYLINRLPHINIPVTLIA